MNYAKVGNYHFNTFSYNLAISFVCFFVGLWIALGQREQPLIIASVLFILYGETYSKRRECNHKAQILFHFE